MELVNEKIRKIRKVKCNDVSRSCGNMVIGNDDRNVLISMKMK